MQEKRGLFLHAIRAEEAVFCWGAKQQKRHRPKLVSFQVPGCSHGSAISRWRPLFYAAANFHFTNAARTVTITIKAMPKGRSFSSTVRNRSDSAGAAQNALIRRFFA